MPKNESDNSIEYLLSLLGSPDVNEEEFSALTLETKAFLDKIPGGFFVYYAEGDEKIIHYNQALLRIFGCRNNKEFEELTGNSFRGMVYHEDLEEVEKSIVKQISDSQFDLDYVEYRIVRKNGDVRWIEDYGHFVRSKTLGNIFYVFINDATEKIERQLAERANLISQRNERERKIESLIEEYDNERKLINQEHLRRLEVIEGLSINYESILFVDLDLGKVVPYRVSSRTAQHFNSNLDERDYVSFVCEYIDAWVHPEDKAMVEGDLLPNSIRAKLVDGKTYFDTFRCVNDDGVQHLQLRVVNVSRGFSQTVIGFRDIGEEIDKATQQKLLLEEALENAKQSANVKNIFLSNMSHDMRTPLNAILGYISIAKKNVNNPEALLSALEKMEKSGAQLHDAVVKVLELSSMENNVKVAEEPCDVCEIVSEVTNSLQSKAVRNEIHLTHSCTNVDGRVFADREKVKQVLFQLTDNAVKYTRRGGTVSVALSEVDKQSNGYVKFIFTVKDNGIGIGAEYLDKIFDPFEREQNSTTGGVYGSGLGLTIARNYAELMDGKLSVNSVKGKGSTFTFTVCLRPQVTTDKSAQLHSVLDEIRHRKILLVDDNEINLEVENEMLKDCGFSTDLAENGLVALEKLQSNAEDCYAVVLMDIQMPVMDGWQATEAIRKLSSPVLSRIPVIAVSANSFASDIHKSLNVGMDAHLPKPLDINRLLDTMSEIVHARKCGNK